VTPAIPAMNDELGEAMIRGRPARRDVEERLASRAAAGAEAISSAGSSKV
jgi:hypothetical protein